MRKYTFLPLLFFWGISPLCAQEPKGAVSVTPPPGGRGETRAVVVGISDYQDPAIPDLQFAHRDAEAFAAWLQSPAGGSVRAENIQVLLNEKATMGRVAMALWALMTQCAEGDQAIIYFSGHGDVETRTIAQPGYWLCWDSPPYAYMSGGCFNVRDLQDIVATLSLQNKARVLVISDACHAGKLAGSDIGGPQATAQNLARQFANEVKILSCQPNEFSLEGMQWGGGRGCFSYHLTDGLYGLADRNEDDLVTLVELENYLEDRVPEETAPHRQFPFTVGDKLASLARVDAPTLARIKAGKTGAQPSLEPIDPRGMEDWVLARADSNIWELYAAFNAALERKKLLEPKGTSADDYYRRLINEPELEPLHGLMTRNFAAALVDESQQVTNKLLKTDPQVVSDVLSRPFVFDHIHTYIARAIELLGDRHFLYKHLKAKQCYFEAKTYRAENYPDWPADSLGKIYILKLENGLQFDSNAAYIHLELAMYYAFFTVNFERVKGFGNKAIELSPQCAAAHFIVGSQYAISDTPVEAMPYLERAMALDSNFLPTYIYIGLVYFKFGNYPKYRHYLEEYVRKVRDLIRMNPDSVPVFYYCQLGNALWQLGRFNEAEVPLLKAVELSKGQAQNAYLNLVNIYRMGWRWEECIQAANKVLELSPSLYEAYWYLGVAYTQLGRIEEAVGTYTSYIKYYNQSDATQSYVLPRVELELSDLYLKTGRTEEAKAILEKLTRHYANPATAFEEYCFALTYWTLGNLYLGTGQTKEAREAFETIIGRYPKPAYSEQFNWVGRAWLGRGGVAAMETYIRNFLETKPNDPEIFYQIGCLYSLAKDEQKALEWLNKALEGGFAAVAWFFLENGDLNNIHFSEGFKALLKKYFPEQVKD